jgi:hypothetical protein
LTTVRLLASHLTPANHRDVLGSARGKRKPEVEEIVARLPPQPDAAILDRALTVLLVDLAKKKFGDTPKPRRSRGTKAGASELVLEQVCLRV